MKQKSLQSHYSKSRAASPKMARGIKAEIMKNLTSGCQKKCAVLHSECVNLTILSEVAKGGGVTIPGIVKISAKHRPARTVRNPGTGKTIEKEADRRVAATPLKAIKDALVQT